MEPAPTKVNTGLKICQPDTGHVSCDWLQIHVKISTGFRETTQGFYRVKRTGQTKVFKDIYLITDRNGNEICVYATNANDCILKKNHGILKFMNKQLYIHSDLSKFISDFLIWFKFIFIGISRLDICYDFNLFFNNRDPHNFIRHFLRDDILKIFKSDFRVAGTHKERNEFNWIYFGSHASDVGYKLYNKSGEQKKKERKPWIWERWAKNSFLDLEKDVWRIEFTVNSLTWKFIAKKIVDRYNLSLGNSKDIEQSLGILQDRDIKALELHSLEILEKKHLYRLFSGLFDHYFQFVKNKRSVTRKDRMEKIKLLDLPVLDEDLYKIIRPLNSERSSSTRSQKIFINALLKHQAELRMDEDFDNASSEMIEKIIDRYNLDDWANEKGIGTFNQDYIYPNPNKKYKDYSGEIQNFKRIDTPAEEEKEKPLNSKQKKGIKAKNDFINGMLKN